MKKLFAVLVVLVLVASVASAQNVWGQGKMSGGVGVELGLPMGSFGDFAGMGIGGFVLGQYGINNDILGTVQIGYTSYLKKSVANVYGVNVDNSASIVPVVIGAKYNLSKYVTPGFYGMAQLGEYFFSTTVSSPATTVTYYGVTVPVPAQSVSGSTSEFIFDIGVGYHIGNNIDASVKYVLNSDVTNLAINVAYVMPL